MTRQRVQEIIGDLYEMKVRLRGTHVSMFEEKNKQGFEAATYDADPKHPVMLAYKGVRQVFLKAYNLLPKDTRDEAGSFGRFVVGLGYATLKPDMDELLKDADKQLDALVAKAADFPDEAKSKKFKDMLPEMHKALDGILAVIEKEGTPNSQKDVDIYPFKRADLKNPVLAKVLDAGTELLFAPKGSLGDMHNDSPDHWERRDIGQWESNFRYNVIELGGVKRVFDKESIKGLANTEMANGSKPPAQIVNALYLYVTSNFSKDAERSLKRVMAEFNWKSAHHERR